MTAPIPAARIAEFRSWIELWRKGGSPSGKEIARGMEELIEERERFLDTIHAIGLALGLPDPRDPAVLDHEGLVAWNGPLSEKVCALVKALEQREELLRDVAAGPSVNVDLAGWESWFRKTSSRIRAAIGGDDDA